MARSKARSKPRSRVFLRFERVTLAAGMTAVVWVIERRLIKGIKKGWVEAAPRTAAGGEPLKTESATIREGR